MVHITSTDQMPSLKMKTKVDTGCLRGRNSLCVSQKSTRISKNSCPHVTPSQQTAEFDICIKNGENDISIKKEFLHVSSSTEVSARDVESDRSINHQEVLDGENLQLQKHALYFVDPISMGRMEFTSASCPSNLETIFSPVLEFIEVLSEPNDHCDTGCNNGPDFSQLRADDINNNSTNSRDYQTCNVSDFYISDMIVAGLPFDENRMFDNITESSSCLDSLDHKCAEPGILFDVAERYMILPFLEDTVETCITHDVKSLEEATCTQDFDVNPCSELDQTECFDPHMFINNFPEPSDVVPNFLPMWKRKRITLVLDLDETLVHSTLEHSSDADFTFLVFFNMKEHTVYVKQRPFLRKFLERVAEMFEVVVFTASQSIYAEQLLDILDPNGKLISKRLYRESCIFSDGTYTKDLTVLDVDLAKVAIIDNSPQVFRLQVNNGIPIESWFDDPSDSELNSLLPFLETLVDADDVRPIIAKRFGNKE